MDDYDFYDVNEAFIPLYKEHWFVQLMAILAFAGAIAYIYINFKSIYDNTIFNIKHLSVYDRSIKYLNFIAYSAISIIAVSYFINVLCDINIYSLLIFFSIIGTVATVNEIKK